MKPKTLILMVVAVSCGLGASYMTSRLLADRSQDGEKVAILVAKKNLNMGETLKAPEDQFEEKLYAKGEEPRLAITEIDKLKGRLLKRSLRAGDFITTEDLHDENSKRDGIAWNLPQGFVAVGIRVNPESIAGGFASLPHSRVNIISTVRKGDDSRSYAKILLENVLVLAADTQTVRSENNNAMPASVVTVALKPEDSLKLELAKTMGTISLALRRFNDNSHSDVTQVSPDGQTGTTSTGTADANAENSASPLGSLPALPSTKEAAVQVPPQPPVEKEPAGKKHVLTITEGDAQRQVNYLLDPTTNRVINTDVQRSDVTPPTAAPKKGE